MFVLRLFDVHSMNPSCAETDIVWDNWTFTVPAVGLAPSGFHRQVISDRNMIMQVKRIFVFNKQSVQLPAPTQRWEIISYGLRI